MLMRVLLCLFLIAVALPAPPRAAAADPFAPAVVVNDQIVTEFDVAQRLRLMQLMGAGQGEDARQQAIDSLIDDRLRDQAAKALGVTLTEAQLGEALTEFASQRNMTQEQMFARLAQAGVTRQAMIDLIANQAAFREAMRIRFLAQAAPTDAEIEAERARGTGLQNVSLRLAEIVLVTRERGEEGTARFAEELYRSLSAGEDFAAAARRVSRSPTARRGGDIGWVPLERLPPSIAGEVALLSPGQVTRPFTVPNATVILKLLETREEATAAAAAPAGEVTVTYGRLIVPLRADASETDIAAAQVEAEQAGRALRSCADVAARARDYGRGSGVAGPVPLASLPEEERAVLATLPAGRASAPVRSGTGIAVLFLCERAGTAAAADPGSIEAVRSRLIAERMVSYATGYLQELRRDAVVEYR